MIGEEDLRPGAKRHPFVPSIVWIAILQPPVDKDWHDGECVIRLKKHVLRDLKSFCALKKRSRKNNRCAEIASDSLSVLNRNLVITTVPLQVPIAYSDSVSVISGNDVTRLCRTAIRSGEIEPCAKFSACNINVIKTHVDVALRVIAIFRYDVGTRTSQVCKRHLADPNIQILNASAVTAHVKQIEIVNLNVLTPVKSLACPELSVRLTLKYIANLN